MGYNLVILLFSAFSFIFYSISSFYSERMIFEYERWGYKKFRKIIASLQFIAAFGLLIGWYFPLLLIFASSALSLMMITAISVRIRIKDNVIKILPAILYAILNFIIFYKTLITNL
jgi:hypothetical protein